MDTILVLPRIYFHTELCHKSRYHFSARWRITAPRLLGISALSVLCTRDAYTRLHATIGILSVFNPPVYGWGIWRYNRVHWSVSNLLCISALGVKFHDYSALLCCFAKLVNIISWSYVIFCRDFGFRMCVELHWLLNPFYRELSRFIAAGRLHCKVDRVGGVVETNRPDSKNWQYQAMVKQGDLLLNRVQKLSRVINI